MEPEKQIPPPEEIKLNQDQPAQNTEFIRKLNVKTLSNNVFALKISPNVSSKKRYLLSL